MDEHDAFSLSIERQNLEWLYKANLDYCQEVSRVSFFDNLVHHGSLKGSIFKAKLMSARRLYGLGSLGAASMAYMHMGTLSLMMGPTVPTLGIVAATVYGLKAFNEQSKIS